MTPEALYLKFADIVNAREYDRLEEVMVPGFVDHHPGLVDVTDLDTYRANLTSLIGALGMVVTAEQVVAAGDKVFTRIRLTGKHTGTFLGVPASGNQLDWYTHELWRIENGRFVERWAVDDLLTLVGQLGVAMPTWGAPDPAATTA
ncbi:MAG TPA: ester cyclase [Pseudonocardiaceae bacterium]|nr:ester cyclase [Pseudonocardiaceae bacterium]